MTLWTIVPEDIIWGRDEAQSRQVEVKMGNRVLILDVDSQGRARVSRLMSSDPRDYLDSRWQPGSPFALSRFSG